MSQSIHPSHDGSDTVFSDKYNAHYHSVFGAIEESIHVFIAAGLFHYYKKGYTSLRILEMGFGTGLNAFLAYLEAKRFDLKIDYQTIESDPVTEEIYNKINYPEQLNANEKEAFLKLHTSEWNKPQHFNENFTLTKYHNTIENQQIEGQVDLIFYDAFAPTYQAHLWEEPIHKKLYDHLNPGGALVTYCTKGAFRRMLQSLGYKIEKLNGPAKKREMMRAVK